MNQTELVENPLLLVNSMEPEDKARVMIVLRLDKLCCGRNQYFVVTFVHTCKLSSRFHRYISKTRPSDEASNRPY